MTCSVATFRDATDHLFQLTRDFHACVGPAERRAWASTAAVLAERYASQDCGRATARDLERRLSALRQLREQLEQAGAWS